MYPSVVGHEIVGEVRRVGDKVTSVKISDIVGVGPNVWSCGECSACKKDMEQYCVRFPGSFFWELTLTSQKPDLVET